MNKSGIKDLSALLANKRNLESGIANTFVENFFEILSESLRKEKVVKIKRLGTFKIITVSARKSVDVNTGKSIEISGREKISFVPDVSLRDFINRPFAQFETVLISDGIDFAALGNISNTTFAQANKEVEEKTSDTTLIPSDNEITCDVSEGNPSQPLVVKASHNHFSVPTGNISESPIPELDEAIKINFAEVPTNNIPCKNVENTEQSCGESGLQNITLQKQNEEIFKSKELFRKQIKRAYRIICIIAIVFFVFLLFVTGGFFYLFSRISTISTSNKQLVHKQIHLPTRVSVTKKRSPIIERYMDKKKIKDSIDIPTKNENLVSTDYLPNKFDSDARVRTGAYRIIGVKTTVKVQVGQTLSTISKLYLGPGMECYVEAINGIHEVKEGQVIKIPELKRKHKK